MAAHQELSGQLGRYVIVRKLGAGGMGSVYLAEDSKIGRKVALKVPHISAEDSVVVERFRREARLAAGIEHPNLCPVYDVDDVNGVLFFTMPFIEGMPLAKLIEEGKPWPATKAIEVVRKLAAAIGHLHQRGILHRDLKPQNVMVRASGEPIVMDFGLARSFKAKTKLLTTLGKPLGSPSYMSPEQVAGSSRLGPATDVYGLGMILYELLTAQLPFGGPLQSLFYQILSVNAAAPSSMNSGIDARLDAVCLKALHKKPEERHGSAEALAADLEALVGVQTIPVATPVATQVPAPFPETVAPSQRETMEPVRVECPHCRQAAVVPATLVGRNLKCPTCGGSLGRLHTGVTLSPPSGVGHETMLANQGETVKHSSAQTHPANPLVMLARENPLWLLGGGILLVLAVVLGIVLSPGKPEAQRPGHHNNGGSASRATLHLRLPASVAVQAGTSLKFDVRLTRQGDSGRVQLVLATQSPDLSVNGFIEAGADRGVVDLVAGSAAAAETRTIQLIALGEQARSEVTDLEVTVTTMAAPPPAASLALRLRPAEIVVEAGQKVTVTVEVSRRNVVGAVQVREVVQAGVTLTTTFVAQDADEGTLEVSAAENAPLTTQDLPVTASISGINSAPVRLTVTVKRTRLPQEIVSVRGMKLVLIKAGKFRMGTPASELKYKDEGPQHQVEITRDFYMGATEVTVGQFQEFVKANPGFKTDAEKAGDNSSWRNPGFTQADDHPVVYVSWNDADAFCKWLSAKENKTYELPYEAEWEYACRAGTTTVYHFGDACNDSHANCDGRYPHGGAEKGNWLGATCPVKKYAANKWGLYDMHGNAWEWCQDYLREYKDEDITDPKGGLSNNRRVLRGGSWGNSAIYCRAAVRVDGARDGRNDSIGFRVVCRLASRTP